MEQKLLILSLYINLDDCVLSVALIDVLETADAMQKIFRRYFYAFYKHLFPLFFQYLGGDNLQI